ncbi:histidinol-phosphate transaminase [Rhodobacteraceae bacterium]|nr:histidinol-phosphate transaminase [Paracoccaceae bacterium]
MTNLISPKPGIDQIALYQGGASQLEGRNDVLKLSSNENPFGVPDAAKTALIASANTLHRYPPTDHADLRAAIAEVHGLDADRIICGAGSDEVIEFLCQAYAGQGTEVITTEHGFSMHRISALASGATPVEVPERDRVVDIGAILNGVTDKTRLIFIANPANPTATMLDDDTTRTLAEALPPHVILVLDGAYAEYVDGFDGGAALIEARSNVVMTRTFSKLYGLGGLRIGWGYGPVPIIENLNRVRGPFNLSNTQLVTAEAAVRDTAWAARCLSENTKNRAWLADALAALDVPSDASSANFILARFANQAAADACEEVLREDGILVRKVAGYKLPECLRITVGSEADCRRVVTSVRRFREIQS